MSIKEKFCCNNWTVFGPKAREVIANELKGTEPKYLVEPILSWLHTIDNICPSCGEPLKSDLPTPVSSNTQKRVAPRTPPLPKVCPFCKGKKLKGDGTVCNGCMGTGDVRNGIRAKIAREIS